jgi:hypothetical protein
MSKLLLWDGDGLQQQRVDLARLAVLAGFSFFLSLFCRQWRLGYITYRIYIK